MQTIRSLTLTLALVGAVAAPSSFAAHDDHNKGSVASKASGELVAATDKDASWVAEQKAKYPTSMCIVSDEKLGGDMGKPVDFIYRVAGKPDRLVTFCCKDCVSDFNKDPQKYLTILDQAAAKKADGHAKH